MVCSSFGLMVVKLCELARSRGWFVFTQQPRVNNDAGQSPSHMMSGYHIFASLVSSIQIGLNLTVDCSIFTELIKVWKKTMFTLACPFFHIYINHVTRIVMTSSILMEH
jgi:hypothetical protein